MLKRIMLSGAAVITAALAFSTFTASAQATTTRFNFNAGSYWAKGYCYFGSINARCVVKNRKGQNNPVRRRATTEIISYYVFKDKSHSKPYVTRCTSSKSCTQKFNTIGYLSQPIGIYTCIRAKSRTSGGFYTAWLAVEKRNQPLGRRAETMTCQP